MKLLTLLLFLVAVQKVVLAADPSVAPPELQDPPTPVSSVDNSLEDPTDIVNSSKKYIMLTIGIEHDEKVIKLPPGVSFKGDYKKVANLSYAKEINTLRFTPKNVGVATLTAHDSKGRIVAEYRIDVKKSNIDKTMREIRSLLGDIEGIEIKLLNNRVVVDGQILLPKDMSRIGNVVMQYGDQAASLVSLSPIAQKLIAEKIEKDINNPEVTVRAVNEKFLLEGAVSSKDEFNRAEIIAKTYVPDLVVDKAEGSWIKKPKVDLVINLLTIKEAAPSPPGKIIQLVFHYVELNKDYTKGFRFQWTPDISDGSKVEFGSTSRSPGSVISSIAGTVSNLLPKLNWAKQHGHARVLQSSSLIVEAGKEGILNSTTKVPYQVINQNGVPGTQFQDVGIQAKVTPRILGESSDSINLEMNFSISSLIGITDSGPMTSNSQVQTIVAVRSGQSAAIGGLISNSQSTGYNRLPKNSSENPLISLYASKDFNRKQSQFVVFITPIIKSSASAGSEKIKKKFHLRD